MITARLAILHRFFRQAPFRFTGNALGVQIAGRERGDEGLSTASHVCAHTVDRSNSSTRS